MKKTPVKGMKEYLPIEMELRDYLTDTILKVYRANGFQRIATPIIEDMENLKKSEGGDNLNLLFEIMKRGDKLSTSIQKGEYDKLADLGLRYDLTLPLSRYYANNKENLMNPFRCIQLDRVYRAERPQKGRLREFVQCDIDIIGTKSNTAEIELITTTVKALEAIGITNFTVKINDRKLLQTVLLQFGFRQEELDTVCITLDKLDKIGKEGIREELTEKGIDQSIQDSFLAFVDRMPLTLDDIKEVCEDKSVVENVETIINTVEQLAQGKYGIQYDFTLVRGQGYYTGTIFEVVSSDFNGAIAGGGRYDNLIGKFTKESIPAVGFSIGFERIFGILSEKKIKATTRKKYAVIYDEKDFLGAMAKADELRQDADVMLVVKKKNYNNQLNLLRQQGVEAIVNMNQSEELVRID